MRTLRLLPSLSVLLASLLASCGGGGGGAAKPAPPAVTPPVVIPPAPGISVLTGQLGGRGNLDGVGAAARFDGAVDVAVDVSGQVFVAETSGRIRRISVAGEVSTFAGGYLRDSFVDGTGAAAGFQRPNGLAFDPAGNLYVADLHAVRKITPAGVVTTLAGSGQPGDADGVGAAAGFMQLTAIAVDAAGNVYVADWARFTVRKITSAGVVTTFAGVRGGRCDYQHTTPACTSNDGTATTASFSRISGLASDGHGGLYVVDGALRKVSAQGDVSTLAFGVSGRPAVDRDGNILVTDGPRLVKYTPAGTRTTVAGPVAGGPALPGLFSPQGIALDSKGNVLVADDQDIGRVSPAGAVSVVAGAYESTSSLGNESGSAGLDGAGNLYLAGMDGQTVLKVAPSGSTTVLAGAAGQRGTADGPAGVARFSSPHATAVDGSGNVYVADGGLIRRITPEGTVSTLAGNFDAGGPVDGTGANAHLYATALVADSGGNVYFTEGCTVRRVTPQGTVATLIGQPDQCASVDGPAGVARFAGLAGIAIDPAGVLYVADREANTIRRIGVDGSVSTLAGRAGATGSADGAGQAARFNQPGSLSLDETGLLLVADSGNHTIREIAPSGVVTTVAGQPGSVGVRLGALPGSLGFPRFVVAAKGGRLFVRTEDAVLAIQQP